MYPPMKRPRASTKSPRAIASLAAATILATACSFHSASASYADYNHTAAQPIDGGFRCTTPGGGGSTVSPSRTATPFHLLQFCFVPDQSAFLYLHIDYGDGQTGHFGAQVTEGVEYCRPKTPKPILGNAVRHAHVEFDDVRVVQATILSSSDGCLVLEGEVSDNGEEEISIDGNVTSTGEGQIKLLHGDFSVVGDSNEEVENEKLENNEGMKTPEEDGMPNEIEEGHEYDLDFEIVPPSRYGESLGPVQAIIGLDRPNDVASKGERTMSNTYGIFVLFCALQAAMIFE